MQLLRPFLLRRIKDEVETNLPPRVRGAGGGTEGRLLPTAQDEVVTNLLPRMRQWLMG